MSTVGTQLEMFRFRQPQEGRVYIEPVLPDVPPADMAMPEPKTPPPEALARAPASPLALARRAVSYLAEAADWRTRADMERDLGFSDRDCRLAGQFARGQIICGQRGFKLTALATEAEYQAFVAAQRSEIGEREKRLEATRIYRQAALGWKGGEIPCLHES